MESAIVERFFSLILPIFKGILYIVVYLVNSIELRIAPIRFKEPLPTCYVKTLKS